MSPAKYGILAFWAYCAICFFVDSDSSFVVMGRLLFWATAIAHVAEFAIFFGVFRKAGGSLANHFAQTMTFGLFHIREVRSQLRASSET